tara:strand:- start:1970 stop:2278 length:309 start_codon:yes stop_codon:yes gene_type:complete
MRAVFFVTLFSLTTKSPPPFTYVYTHTEEIEERKKTREADAQAAQSWRSKGLINSQRASTRARFILPHRYVSPFGSHGMCDTFHLYNTMSWYLEMQKVVPFL